MIYLDPSRRALPPLLCAALATATACGPFGGAKSPRPPIPSAAVGVVLPGPLSQPFGAEALYGGGTGSDGMARWRPRRLWQLGGPKFDAATAFLCADVNMLPFEQAGGVRAFLVAIARPTDYTHDGSAPVVGALALTEVAGGWRVDAFEPELGTWGDKGDLTGTARTVKIAPDRHALMLEPVVEANEKSVKSLILIAEQAGKLIEVLRIDEAQVSFTGACGEGKRPCWGWEGDWNTIAVAGRDVFAFEVTKSGTRWNETTQAQEDFSEKRTYDWNGTRYEPAPGEPDEKG